MRLLPAVSLAIFFTIRAAHARDLTDGKCDCQLTIPDDWNASSQPVGGGDFAYLAGNAGKTAGMSLYVAPNDNSDHAKSEYLRGFEASLHDHGLDASSKSKKKIGDLDFLVYKFAPVNGAPNTTGLIAFTDGHAFQIALYTAQGDPLKDPILTKIVESFAVLHSK
jgi:hypothetical protein